MKAGDGIGFSASMHSFNMPAPCPQKHLVSVLARCIVPVRPACAPAPFLAEPPGEFFLESPAGPIAIEGEHDAIEAVEVIGAVGDGGEFRVRGIGVACP
jgi:hypothetical protein